MSAAPGAAADAPGWTRARTRAALLSPRTLLPVALLLWLLSLRHVALDRMGDLGLLQVLPVLYWVSAALLTIGFALSVRDRTVGQGWLAGYVLGLIAVIHATPALLYPTLRYAWAWKHLAIIDAMLHYNGSVPNAGTLDIYNQWPGFFGVNGLLLRITGLHSALGYAAWAPPFVNALLLVPLLLLYRAITTDRTLVWGGAWIFYACSWVGQDYFAPQAFGFLLFVVLLALVFRQLADQPRRAEGKGGTAVAVDQPPGEAGGSRPLGVPRRNVRGVGGWTAGRFLMVVLIEATIVCSHQLTPLMMITAFAALSLPRRFRSTALPALIAAIVLTGVWNATVAEPYVSSNLGNFVQALTTPDGNATSGLANVGTAASGQVIVDWVDRLLSASVILLAAAAVWRRPWVRRSGLVLTALSPFPLLAANSYGGEMLFRTYLFALPSTAFLVGSLLLVPAARRGLRAATTVAVLLALLGGLYFGYDSKEAMNYFTPQEVAAARFVTTQTPSGALIVAVTGAVPGIDDNYQEHPQVLLTNTTWQVRSQVVADPIAGLEDAVGFAPPGVPAYLVLSRAQAAECLLTGALPADTVAQLTTAAELSPDFTLVYRNAEAVIYRFVPNPLPAPAPAPSPAPAAPTR